MLLNQLLSNDGKRTVLVVVFPPSWNAQLPLQNAMMAARGCGALLWQPLTGKRHDLIPISGNLVLIIINVHKERCVRLFDLLEVEKYGLHRNALAGRQLVMQLFHCFGFAWIHIQFFRLVGRKGI